MYGSQVSSARSLAVAGDRVQLLVGQRRQVDRVVGRVVEAQPVELLARHREHVGNVELVGGSGLDAHWTDQHQPADPLRHLGGKLGRDPAADREADQIGAGQPHPIHQFEIDVGDVVDAVEPVGQ